MSGMNALEVVGSSAFVVWAICRCVSRWDFEPFGRWVWMAVLLASVALLTHELYLAAHGRIIYKP